MPLYRTWKYTWRDHGDCYKKKNPKKTGIVCKIFLSGDLNWPAFLKSKWWPIRIFKITVIVNISFWNPIINKKVLLRDRTTCNTHGVQSSRFPLQTGVPLFCPWGVPLSLGSETEVPLWKRHGTPLRPKEGTWSQRSAYPQEGTWAWRPGYPPEGTWDQKLGYNPRREMGPETGVYPQKGHWGTSASMWTDRHLWKHYLASYFVRVR